MEPLMSISEASEFLGLKKSTLYKYCCSRKVPFVKINSRVLFSREKLEEWIASHIVEAIPTKTAV